MVSPITEGFVDLNVVVTHITSINASLYLDVAKLIAQYAQRTDTVTAQKWRERGIEIEEPPLPNNIDGILERPEIKNAYFLALVPTDIHGLRRQGAWVLIPKGTKKNRFSADGYGHGKQ